MDDIKALEARIGSALDRIGTTLAAQSPASGSAALEALEADLQEERFAAAQLREQMDRMRTERDTVTAQQNDRLAEQAAHMAELDAQMQQLRQSNVDLTDLCSTLRKAATDGVADAALINDAMAAEVDGLAAQRAAEAAEIAAILSELKPFISNEA